MVSLDSALNPEAKPENRLRKFATETYVVSTVIFCLVALCYFPGKPEITDPRWTIPTALSIIREGNTDLSEYQALLARNRYHDLQKVGDRYYTGFPAGVSLLAVPFTYFFYRFSDLGGQLARGMNPTGPEHFVAIFFVALTAVFIYLITRRLVRKQVYALLLVFIFAFCTSAWSTASVALFEHGPSMLMLSVTLYLLLLAREQPQLAQYASLPLAYSYVIRPTNIIPAVLLTVYIAIKYRKYFLRYMIWGLPVAVGFILYNFAVYGSPLSLYASNASPFANPQLLAGLAGNLISPARGLLVFSPVLIFSFAGIYLKLRKKEMTRLDYFLAAVILLHWMLISLYNPWWGGHSYGPRYFTDMIPFLIYFMVPAVNRFDRTGGGARLALAPLIAVLIGISFFANYQGTASDPARSWNVHPEIFSHQDRLWDWSQIPYLTRDFTDRP